MDELKNNKKTIIICLSIIIVFGIIFYYISNKDKYSYEKNESYRSYTKIDKYEANEYIPIYITESDVVKKYFNDYKNNMIYNVDEAYNMLNKEYREKRFGSLDSYKEYIDRIISLSMYSMEVDKYSVSKSRGMNIFIIYDTSGYKYIIKEKSIMDYEVYLDENTVAIR